ncbi:stage III sporulation protein AD [Alkalibacillus haloalkaliphilus]|uniref:Stage III sporulation protein AD n=1 Tax=Alkalibacillus haloalkaliphilus TaxID=94136 RepID=A0A511W4N3_9BACI|nr:stage III sporulation protein AD [Alkalibacillus haloalkaliphilus]MDV2580956.1 stage III sporulation protein AD [Alkalibacillus haloalkaliphilus]GEN45288.1 stage III sporulation protein AD [Alkalibacillus haloalkaliphilus]
MPFLQMLSVIIVAAILIIVVREKNHSIGFLLTLLTGTLVFFFILTQIGELISVFQQVTSRMNVSLLHLDTIFKVIGVAYITEFASQVLRDANLASIAIKVEIVGKLFILLIALPIFITVIETLLSFIPQ